MADDLILHVAVAPPANLEANMVARVAALIDKTPYDTRLLLAGEIPKIIAHCGSMELAESVTKKLHDLGLAAMVFRYSEFSQSPPSFKAHALEFREKEVLFRDRAGHEKRIGEGDVFLILEGRMQRAVEVETIKTKTKISLAGTLLTGGIPIRRKVEEKTIAQSIQTEYFARLYDRNSSDPCIDLLQHNMDYSFLKEEMEVSSVANFGIVVLKLRKVFPQAIFDNRMTKPFAVNAYSSRVWEDIEVICRLIYLFHLAIVNRKA